MATQNPDFAQMQRRLRGLGLYPAAPYPIDDEWGSGMRDGINALLDRAEKAAGVTPPAAPRWPQLPEAYAWLRTVDQLPRHVGIALDLLGTRELAGAANSPTIMGWTKELKDAGHPVLGYSADSIAWCGLFVAIVMLRAQRPVPDNPLWALNWSRWGEDGGQPDLGDVLVFKRDGGGHVAIYIGEDPAGYFHILGGNQSDQVNIMRIAKSRLYACRQPPYKTKPAGARPMILAAAGQISHNEA